ncbi:MAG: VOC family protein [Gammaproteobacteria bacterium]|nr:VOC family protein [Gammaproteobacteria bacterium]
MQTLLKTTAIALALGIAAVSPATSQPVHAAPSQLQAMTLQHIAIRVTDFDRTVSWYKDIFGAREQIRWNAPPYIDPDLRFAYLEFNGVVLVGHTASSVMLRAAVQVRIKARFAGKGLFPWREAQRRVALAQPLPKGRDTSVVVCVVVLGKGQPLPANDALPTTLVSRLSVTELAAWPTRVAGGGSPLHIAPRPRSIAEDFTRSGWAHICFVVDDAEAAMAELRAKGVEIYAGPFTNPTLNRTFFHIKDPEGTWIEFVEILGAASQSID